MSLKSGNRHAYRIEIPKLKDGNHTFIFLVGDGFFEDIPDLPIEWADVHVSMQLTKTSRLIDAQFVLTGKIALSCDRCLLPFHYPIEATQRLIYSFDPDFQMADDTEVFYVNPGDVIDLKQDLYDFICLCVPMRRIPEGCPGSMCPPDVLKALRLASHNANLTEEYPITDTTQANQANQANTETEDRDIDLPPNSPWHKLKKLRDSLPDE